MSLRHRALSIVQNDLDNFQEMRSVLSPEVRHERTLKLIGRIELLYDLKLIDDNGYLCLITEVLEEDDV